MNSRRILIIEDDDLQYEIYEDALDAYELVRFSTASEALRQLAEIRPNAIILDHILARGELGLSYLNEFRELLPYVPVIIVSGALEAHEQMNALQGPRRAHYCITKPVDVQVLVIPLLDSYRVAGLEKDPAQPCNSLFHSTKYNHRAGKKL